MAVDEVLEGAAGRAPGLAAALRSGMWWLAVLAVGIYQLGIVLLNSALFPLFSSVFIEARDLGSLFSAVLSLALYVGASRRPAWFAPRRWLVVSLVTVALALPLILLAARVDSAPLLLAGALVRSVGSTWFGVTLYLALAELARSRGLRAMFAALCVGWAFSYVLEFVLTPASQAVQLVAFYLSAFLVIALTYRSSRPLLASTLAAPPEAELRVTSPRSFLPLSSAAFVTLVLLKMSFGFAVGFASVDAVPQQTVLACVPALLVALSLLASGRVELDPLYRATMLCVLAGFLLVNPLIASITSVPALANVVLRAGGDLTRMLAFLLVAHMGVRNPMGALGVALYVSGANALGSVAGAQLGYAADRVLAADLALFALLIAAVIFAFVAYNVLSPDAFALDDVVGAVEEASLPQAPTAPADALVEACARLAAERGLTPREAEALELLAHGRNTAAIQERMVVSRSTAKTHVRNVYAKLGVHSQQSLIDVVECAVASAPR